MENIVFESLDAKIPWQSLIKQRLASSGKFHLPTGMSVLYHKSAVAGCYAFHFGRSEHSFYLNSESLRELGEFLLLLSKQAEEE